MGMEHDSIVFGAAGFIGRFLVAELLRRGRVVAATVRGDDRLTPWLRGRGVDVGRLEVITADITRPGLGLPQGLDAIRDVYNPAARFAFGLTVEEARATNVTGARHVVDWTATLRDPRRLVHVTGYRAATGPADYRTQGAYEASKREGDAVVRARAAELGVPWTIVNPSTVIGPEQYIGLAGFVADLWHGRLPVLPGGRDTFLPVVTAGYLAAFMVDAADSAEASGRSYTVLDDSTPVLPELVRLLAGHLGVRAPRRTIPVALVRRLPRALTGADHETLAFLSADRYDTAPAEELARATGLRMPEVTEALREWADGLVAARFGKGATPGTPSGFHDVGGSRTWVAGDRTRPEYVLLHGLPLDSDSWTEVASLLHAPHLAADLPGLGRSAPSGVTRPAWLADLMRPVETTPVLVAHSLACGPALDYATAHPERVSGLVLVSPAFLQAPSAWLTRSPLAVAALRRMTPARLARTLGVPESPAIASAAANLGRPGVAGRVVAAMRTAHAERPARRTALDGLKVPVTLVAGSADPLIADREAHVIAGAGHFPQLTHPGPLVAALTTTTPARRHSRA
jgi:nucleoside-diphosphate-sugar epimerase/pimeloyl-ACP methyl ester carboxylesterase